MAVVPSAFESRMVRWPSTGLLYAISVRTIAATICVVYVMACIISMWLPTCASVCWLLGAPRHDFDVKILFAAICLLQKCVCCMGLMSDSHVRGTVPAPHVCTEPAQHPQWGLYPCAMPANCSSKDVTSFKACMLSPSSLQRVTICKCTLNTMANFQSGVATPYQQRSKKGMPIASWTLLASLTHRPDTQPCWWPDEHPGGTSLHQLLTDANISL